MAATDQVTAKRRESGRPAWRGVGRRLQATMRRYLPVRGRRLLRLLGVGVGLGFGWLPMGPNAPKAQAAPQGEQVIAGEATFTREGAHTTIQTSHQAIINYQSFDIARHESVLFQQPAVSSRVLNRVISDDPTRIMGSLSSNGQVYLINQAGIVFGQDAFIDVGGRIYIPTADEDPKEVRGRMKAVRHAKEWSSEQSYPVKVERADGRVKMTFRDGVLVRYGFRS